MVAKILVDDVIRPAGWSRNAENIPNQYPCCLATAQNLLILYIERMGCQQLQDYKIGKGQLPAGLIANCRTPKLNRHMAGGNDQLQRACRFGGIAKGKDGAVSTNSSCATVSFVAGTQYSPSFQHLRSHPPSLPPNTPHVARPKTRAPVDDDLLLTYMYIISLFLDIFGLWAPVLDEQCFPRVVTPPLRASSLKRSIPLLLYLFFGQSQCFPVDLTWHGAKPRTPQSLLFALRHSVWLGLSQVPLC